MIEHNWERDGLLGHVCWRCGSVWLGWAMSGGTRWCMTAEDYAREAESFCLDYPGTTEGAAP